MIFRIPAWDQTFENSSSRKLKRLDWVAIPNKTDGEGYTALVDHPNAAAHLGAWYAIVEAASKQNPRGCLPRGIPNNLNGVCRSLARMSRLPAQAFEEVIPRLLEIGWLEQVAESADTLGESANASAESADVVGDVGRLVAAQGRELQGITGKGNTQHSRVREMPRATEVSHPSQRFEEFWTLYPRKFGKEDAARDWVNYVAVDNEADVFACLRRYLESPEVARGAVMNPGSGMRDLGWIAKCAKDQWKSDWGKARDSPTKTRSFVADVEEVIGRNIQETGKPW